MTFASRFALGWVVLVAWSAAAKVEAQVGCRNPSTGVCEVAVTESCSFDLDCAPGDTCSSFRCGVTLSADCLPCALVACGALPVTGCRNLGSGCVCPDGCGGEVTIATATSSTASRVTNYCFLDAMDHTRPVPIRLGDCDGDGLPNGMDTDSMCLQVVREGGGVGSTVPTTLGTTAQVTCGASAYPIAPMRCVSDPRVLGLACAEGMCESGARCVQTTSTAGICTFAPAGAEESSLDRTDTSCVRLGMASGDIPRACTANAGMDVSWAAGDCDRDGVANNRDAHVCAPLGLIGRLATGTFSLFPGPVTSCTTMPRPVLPASMGCAPESDALSFGIHCATGSDCPLLDGYWGRCVRLPSAAAEVVLGVCLYDAGMSHDDTSCLLHPPSSCLLSGDNYANIAAEDCDGTLVNQRDDQVCWSDDAGVVHLDAGVVAGDAGADAWAIDAFGEDAYASDDAPRMHDDARPTDDIGRVEFGGGGGCTCSTHTRASRHGALALSALLLGGIAHRRRRARKIS